jgi:RTX calcium-binding nonapeptide repeat (4 copies)
MLGNVTPAMIGICGTDRPRYRRSGHRVIVAVAALVTGQLVVGATGAPAGTVSLRPDAEFTGWAVAFDAAPGERNQLEIRDTGNPTMSPARRSWQIRDSGAALTAGEHCTAIDAHTAHCGSAIWSGLVFGARVALDDHDDRLSVISPVPEAPLPYALNVKAEGGAGNDRLHGGAGFDELGGGGGLDELHGNDGNDMLSDGDRDGAAGERAPSADWLDGGAGDDLVSYHARRSSVSVDLADPRPDGAPGERDVLTTVESIVGGRGSDRLAGDNGPNMIDGGGGRDGLFGRGGNDKLAFRRGSFSCGRGADVVFDHTLSSHAHLVPLRFSDQIGYVKPDCETVRPRARHTWMPAYPARVRPSWVGYRVSCDINVATEDTARCSGAVRLTEASRRHRVLGSGTFPRGRWEGRMVRVRLTPLGRRLASRRHGVRATINIRRSRTDEPLRWVIRLKIPH